MLSGWREVCQGRRGSGRDSARDVVGRPGGVSSQRPSLEAWTGCQSKGRLAKWRSPTPTDPQGERARTWQTDTTAPADETLLFGHFDLFPLTCPPLPEK